MTKSSLLNLPLPHDDHSPSDEESITAFLAKPWGAWFDDDDTFPPEGIDFDIPENQTDDERTDE